MNKLHTAWQRFVRYPLWLRCLLPLSATTFAVLLISMMLLYPDAPVTAKAGQYLGKYGALHSQESFQTYTMLNRSLLASSLVLFALLVCSVVFHPPPQATPEPPQGGGAQMAVA